MKPVYDYWISIFLIVLLLPVFIVLALLVRCKLGKPVFYRQVRPGLYGKPFTLYKFRSMTNEKDVNGKLLPDSERFTRFSYFLRKSSIDELPELFNVLKGDMSLVGPRPLLMQYLDRYNEEQARRHEVRPGITGLAQVNGRNNLSWNRKFKLDVWYVDNQNTWLDIKILLMTIFQVYKAEGVNQKGHVTAEEFWGNNENDQPV